MSQRPGMVPGEQATKEALLRVRNCAVFLSANQARRLNAVVTDSYLDNNQTNRFSVLLLENRESIKEEVARILKVNTFLIRFYTDEAMKFDIYFREAYPDYDKKEESLTTQENGKERNGDSIKDFFLDNADDRGIMPDELIADYEDATGRQNLTDENEFEKNRKKSLSELATIELGRLILWEFIRSGGSDLYLEPQGKIGRVRVMVDDRLRSFRAEWSVIPKQRFEDLARTLIGMTRGSSSKMKREVVDSSIKVSARVNNEIKDFEFRFHSHPTVQGTSCVIRSQSNLIKDFAKIGIEDFQIENMRRAGRERQGMILITGPTGSGKTGTLECNYHDFEQEREKKIIEIVDTVEVISTERDQIEIKEPELTWDMAFHACLRSKPHIIGIGEMRGVKETVKAVEAAMTGHLVLATYHAGSILKTISRLRQMDVDILQLAPSLNMIHSQILVNKLCTVCRDIDQILSSEFNHLVYRAGKGCEDCDGKRYRGKSALAESLEINEEVEDMIIERIPEKQILTEMRRQKLFVPFAITARMKVWQGITSMDEVSRLLGKVLEQFYGSDEWLKEEWFQASRAAPKSNGQKAYGNGNSNGNQSQSKVDYRILELIKKLNELAVRGETAGEKQTAQLKMDELIEKHGITEQTLKSLLNTEQVRTKQGVRL